MAKSAPHIYLSALPFAPTCSLVSTHYSTSFPRILHVEHGQLSRWPLSEMVILNVGAAVSSIAVSPDGQHFVSGLRDRTIRVWNTMTGETAAGPFTGHTDRVSSVAFSPDGQRVVSGSLDRTIRVWNSMTGESTADSFTGHTGSVRSVAFSPDGQRIVSGSADRTIRVWNAVTGETVAGPLTGHTSWVNSVAFSPDGQHIVSGSFDRTIRVWNVMTGGTVAGPFTGHTGSVLSVAFSPDGEHIVSGSEDRTIRVWSAVTGLSRSVKSVTFSPVGQHMVLGSDGLTIPVSNVTRAKTVGTTNDVDFTDPFITDDEGWICGRKGELLMWIPSEHMEHLRRSSTISGKPGTSLNLSNFVHGRSWATCINTQIQVPQ